MYKILFSFCFFTGGLSAIFAQKDTILIEQLIKRANVFEANNEIDSQMVYLDKALALSRKLNYKKGLSNTLGSKGIIYMHRGDYSNALKYYFEGLKVDEAIDNKSGILSKSGNIGIVYDYQQEFEKALNYYKRALELARELKNDNAISLQYCNIAIVYCNLGKFSNALDLFKKALEIDRKLNDREGMARNLNNIGNVTYDMGNAKGAQPYYLESLAISKVLKSPELMVGNLVNIANAYNDLKQYQLAEQYYLEGLAVSKSVDDKELISQVALSVSEFYSGMGNHQKALDHYKDYIAARDTVYSIQAAKASVREEMNYEFDKKKTATKFKHDREIYELESRNKLNRQLGIFMGVVLVLSIVLLAFVKRAFNTKKRLTVFLQSEDQRKQLLLQEVHHRINNNLQIISGLLMLQANSSEDPKLQEYLEQSQNRIQSLASMHELMYDNDSSIEIAMDAYLNKILGFHRNILGARATESSIHIEIPAVKFPARLAVPIALIVNELVTNAFKYAFTSQSNGVLNISMKESGSGKWNLIVSDNGKGMPEVVAQRKGSLGLKLVTMMVRQLKGELEITVKEGTIFTIEFPFQVHE